MKLNVTMLRDFPAAKYEVELTNGNSKTKHIVSLTKVYFEELTENKVTSMELLELIFKFLLKKVTQKNVPKEFNVPILNHYYSDFEESIKKSINSV